MACPFAAAATLGGIFVGSKLLLFKDKYRVLMWLGFLAALAGWLLYVLWDRPLWLRIGMEVQSTALVLGMIARVFYLVRVQRQSLEIPRFLRQFLAFLRPFALHPLTLAFKGLLLALILADTAGLVSVPPVVMYASISLLIGWLVCLIVRHSHSAAAAKAEPESLHAQLRRETREIHEQLEAGTAVNTQMVQRIDLTRLASAEKLQARAHYRQVYARYLVGAYGFERAMELAIDESAVSRALHKSLRLPREPGPPSALIALDLADVDEELRLAILQPMPNLPAFATVSRAAGADYVRRGSRMGGAVLARIVQHNLGYSAQHGARFLNLYGPALKPRFDEFCARLNAGGKRPFDRAEVVAAAQDTFAAVFAWQKSLENAPSREFAAPRHALASMPS